MISQNDDDMLRQMHSLHKLDLIKYNALSLLIY